MLPPRRLGPDPYPAAVDLLSGLPQRLELAHPAEAAEGARLDLAHPLRRDAELAADLAQRGGVAAGDPVAHLDHRALAVGQLFERPAERLLGERDVDEVLGAGAGGGQEVAEGGVLAL